MTRLPMFSFSGMGAIYLGLIPQKADLNGYFLRELSTCESLVAETVVMEGLFKTFAGAKEEELPVVVGSPRPKWVPAITQKSKKS